jgi:hypothetical protein
MTCTLPPRERLASAAAVFCGRYGDVTQLAQRCGLGRQTLYRQADALLEDLDRYPHETQQLRQQLQQLQAHCEQLQQRLTQAIVLDADRQAEFAATAQAEGVSLPATRRLLQVFLGARTPSVAKLGRWTQASGQRCGALLEVLDEFSRPRVHQAAADEIFVRRRPILMVVEPNSLCWVSGRRVEHRDGATWAEEFGRLPALEQVTKDGGTGLANGLEQVNQQRQQHNRPAVQEQDDHFHVLRAGRKALRGSVSAARRALDKAEKAEKKERRRQRRPRAGKRSGHASVVALRWRQAEAAFDAWGRQERAWQQVEAALTLFDSAGSLPTPTQAEAAVAAVLPELAGQRWAKVRRLLVRPQLWTYLRRAQEQLAALPVAAELKKAALQVEGLRRRPEGLRGEDASAAALRGVLLAAGLVLSLSGSAGAEALTRVRGVLSGVWRASSLVEGINSVLRMQQARHRKVTPGLLDLKRLYWNCRHFRTGKRRRRSPYDLLCVALPPLPWWELLKWSPEQLRAYLSTARPGSNPEKPGGELSPPSPSEQRPVQETAPPGAQQELSAPGVAA